MDYEYWIDQDRLWPTSGEFPKPLLQEDESTLVWKHLNYDTLCTVIGNLLAQPNSPARPLLVQIIIEAQGIGSGVTLAVLGYADAAVPSTAREHHKLIDVISQLASKAQGRRVQCLVQCHPYGVFWIKERQHVD